MAKKVHDQMNESKRALIKDTFLRLIEEKGFSNVTVKELASRAEINRGTFYLHYFDIFDLIEQIENELLIGMKQYRHTGDLQYMMKCHHENIPYYPLVQILEYLQHNRRTFIGFLGAKGDPAFPQKIKFYLKNELFTENIENMEDHTILKHYASSFFASAFLGVIEDWLMDGMQQSAEETAIMFLKIRFLGV